LVLLLKFGTATNNDISGSGSGRSCQ